jgi:hypothetical protein
LGKLLATPYNARKDTVSQVMQLMRTGKSQYSETEAAEELGISVAQLRTMIRSHVVDRDEDLSNVPATTFQPSDLLILRLLAGMPSNSSQE